MISPSYISSGYSSRQSGCSHPSRMLSLWAVLHFTSKCKPRTFARNSRPARVYLSSPFVQAVYSISPEGCLYIFTLFILYTNLFAYPPHATAPRFNSPYAVCLVFWHMSHIVSLIFGSLVTVFCSTQRRESNTNPGVSLVHSLMDFSLGFWRNVFTRNKHSFEQERNYFKSFLWNNGALESLVLTFLKKRWSKGRYHTQHDTISHIRAVVHLYSLCFLLFRLTGFGI